MSAADYIDPYREDAVRLCSKSGSAFTVMPGRVRWARWLAVGGIGTLVGLGALGVSGHLGAAVACGLAAGAAVLASDGFSR